MVENKVNLKEVTDLLTDKHCVCSTTTTHLQPFELTAWDIISFARQDLAGNSEREMANALFSVNRAIHCRVDELLYSFMLATFFRGSKGRDYGKKLNVLRKLGIDIKPILRKMISDPRNEVEHEYRKLKNKDQVQDALEVGEYFLEATDKYLTGGTEGAIDHMYIEAGEWPKQGSSPKEEDYANHYDYLEALDYYNAPIAGIESPECYEVSFNFVKSIIILTHRSILTKNTRYNKLQLPQDCTEDSIVDFMCQARKVCYFISFDELMQLEEEFSESFGEDNDSRVLEI